jgi:hypothetical protein
MAGSANYLDSFTAKSIGSLEQFDDLLRRMELNE